MVQDVTQASDKLVSVSLSDGATTCENRRDVDNSRNVRVVSSCEQSAEVSVKNKRKQLIAERDAAVEFSEVCIMMMMMMFTNNVASCRSVV